jgi:hypothetical protein
MGSVLALIGAWLLAQAALPPAVEQPPPTPQPSPAPQAATPPAGSPAAQAPGAPELAAPPPEPAPPPLPAPLPEPPLYGHAGMSEVSLALGYSSASGFLGGGGLRYFVVDGIAPGLEASVQTGGGMTVGQLLGSIRFALVRTRQVAFVVTGRGGRVLLSHHDDGWGAGGGAGVIWFASPHAGLELGYDILWLLPQSFCADLSSCSIQGPEIGLRLGF